MNNYGTIYDDVFRTIQERHPELLLPLINEAFHTNYSKKQKILRLPYYIMRYEKKFHEISHDPEKSEKLLTEYKQMLKLLEVKMQHDENGLFQDLLRLIRKVAEFQLRNETKLRERMCNIMGGKVLPLPSDALREAESKGISNGELRVNKLNPALQSQGRTEEIITAASDREYQKKLFEEFGL